MTTQNFRCLFRCLSLSFQIYSPPNITIYSPHNVTTTGIYKPFPVGTLCIPSQPDTNIIQGLFFRTPYYITALISELHRSTEEQHTPCDNSSWKKVLGFEKLLFEKLGFELWKYCITQIQRPTARNHTWLMMMMMMGDKAHCRKWLSNNTIM